MGNYTEDLETLSDEDEQGLPIDLSGDLRPYMMNWRDALSSSGVHHRKGTGHAYDPCHGLASWDQKDGML